MARMKHGAACPEAERPFASDAARLDPGPVNAQPNAGAEEPPTSWREGKTGGDPEQIEAEAPGHCLVPVLPRRAKTSFKGREPLRCAPWLLPPASSKVAGQFRVGAGGAPTSDVGRSHNGPSPAAAEPDAFSELDRGPLGGGAAPITASGATAGILSGPHAHPPELPVSGFGNRNAGVGFYDTRLVSFLIPLDVS